nr:MAG TPA: hypothetical protein [Caudoviricetes sp.]
MPKFPFRHTIQENIENFRQSAQDGYSVGGSACF